MSREGWLNNLCPHLLFTRPGLRPVRRAFGNRERSEHAPSGTLNRGRKLPRSLGREKVVEILPGSVWTADVPGKFGLEYNVYVVEVVDGGSEFETVIYTFSQTGSAWARTPWSLPGKLFREYYHQNNHVV